MQRAENASLKIQVKRQQEEKDCLLADNLRMFEHSVEKSAECYKLEQENQDLRDELAALKAKQTPLGQDASTQTSPVESKDFSVQASPVESKDFSAQASPVESKDFAVQASPVEQTHAVAMKTRKLKVTRRMFAVQTNTVTTKAKTVDEVRQEAAALCERDRLVLLSHDILMCQAEITSILAEAKIVEALLKQEGSTKAAGGGNAARNLAKRERVRAAKAAQKQQAELEEQEKIKAAQAAEATAKALAKKAAELAGRMAVEEAITQLTGKKSGDKAQGKEVLTPLDKMAQFGKTLNTVFAKTDKHGFDFKSLDGGIPALLRLYIGECIGTGVFQLEQRGGKDKFRLIGNVVVDGNVYEHTSPFVKAANIVFWLDDHMFRDACKAFLGFTPNKRDKDVEATIANAFEGAKDTLPFLVLQLTPVQGDSRHGLPLQRITSREGWCVTGSMLQMTLWYYIGKISFLARLDV